MSLKEADEFFEQLRRVTTAEEAWFLVQHAQWMARAHQAIQDVRREPPETLGALRARLIEMEQREYRLREALTCAGLALMDVGDKNHDR